MLRCRWLPHSESLTHFFTNSIMHSSSLCLANTTVSRMCRTTKNAQKGIEVFLECPQIGELPHQDIVPKLYCRSAACCLLPSCLARTTKPQGLQAQQHHYCEGLLQAYSNSMLLHTA